MDKKVREDLTEPRIIIGAMKIGSSVSLPKMRTGANICTHKDEVQNKLKRLVLHMVGNEPVGQLARGHRA